MIDETPKLPTQYAVTATVVHRTYDCNTYWRTTRQLPTFFLDTRAQGIMNAVHAEAIALDILSSCADPTRVEIHVCAVAV